MSPEQPKQAAAKKPDDMLNLFATQVVEDDSVGKFASSLKDIEASSILKDAIDVRDRLKGSVR